MITCPVNNDPILRCYTSLEASWQTMQYEPVHYPDEILVSYSSTFQGIFLYFSTEFRKDIKLVMLINNLTFKNPVKVHNPMNITIFFHCWRGRATRTNIIFNVFRTILEAFKSLRNPLLWKTFIAVYFFLKWWVTIKNFLSLKRSFPNQVSY